MDSIHSMIDEDADVLLAKLVTVSDNDIDDKSLVDSVNQCIEENAQSYAWYWPNTPLFSQSSKQHCFDLCKDCQDCQNDVWFLVSILRQVTLRRDDVRIQVWQQSQNVNFILVEAADHLEEWINDFDESNSEVWLQDGQLYMQIKPSAQYMKLSNDVQNSICRRLKRTNDGVKLRPSHAVSLSLPSKTAVTLRLQPELLTRMIHIIVDQPLRAKNKQSFEQLSELGSEHKVHGGSGSAKITVVFFLNTLLYTKLKSRVHPHESMSSAMTWAYHQYVMRNGPIEVPSEVYDKLLAQLFQENHAEVDSDDWTTVNAYDLDNELARSGPVTIDANAISTALEEFFGERGSGGVSMPWDVNATKPVLIDPDQFASKINMILTGTVQEDDDDDDDDSDDEKELATKLDDHGEEVDEIVKSALTSSHALSPAVPLLATMGVNIIPQLMRGDDRCYSDDPANDTSSR